MSKQATFDDAFNAILNNERIDEQIRVKVLLQMLQDLHLQIEEKTLNYYINIICTFQEEQARIRRIMIKE